MYGHIYHPPPPTKKKRNGLPPPPNTQKKEICCGNVFLWKPALGFQGRLQRATCEASYSLEATCPQDGKTSSGGFVLRANLGDYLLKKSRSFGKVRFTIRGSPFWTPFLVMTKKGDHLLYVSGFFGQLKLGLCLKAFTFIGCHR